MRKALSRPGRGRPRLLRKKQRALYHHIWGYFYVREIQWCLIWDALRALATRGGLTTLAVDVDFFKTARLDFWDRVLARTSDYVLCTLHMSGLIAFLFTTYYFSEWIQKIIYTETYVGFNYLLEYGLYFLNLSVYEFVATVAIMFTLSVFLSKFNLFFMFFTIQLFSLYAPLASGLALTLSNLAVSRLYLVFFSIAAVAFVATLVLEQFSASKRSLTLSYFFRNKVVDQLMLSLMLVLFTSFFVFSENLFMLFLAWIGLNLSLYALIAQFSFSLRAQEAAIKYFVLGLLAAGLFLFGLFLLYVSFGTLSLNTITALGAFGNFGVLANVGISSILLVLLFKLSAFPLQGWAPDVYEGSSWFTVSVMTLVVKPAFVLVLMTCISQFSGSSPLTLLILFFSGIGSMLVGTVGAIAQQKLKRFLAFSSISHVGFMLVLVVLAPLYPVWSLWYLVSYILANLVLLLVLSGIQICGLAATQSKSIVYIAELAYLNQVTPFRSEITLPLTISLCSLAGLPPFMGFFTKLSLILSCVATDSVASWLAVTVVLVLMPLSVFVYFRALRVLWFGGASLAVKSNGYSNFCFSSFGFFILQFIAWCLVFFFVYFI